MWGGSGYSLSVDATGRRRTYDRRPRIKHSAAGMYENVTQVEVERRIGCCHETVREVADYWRSKCADRVMPKRADIDPAELKAYLPSITLVDVVPDERRFVYRLVGTQ